MICAALVLGGMGAKTSSPLSVGYAFSACESWPVIIRLKANGGGVDFAGVAEFGAIAPTQASTNSISISVPKAQDQNAGGVLQTTPGGACTRGSTGSVGWKI